MTSENTHRPAPLPHDHPLVRQANLPRYRPERIASAVAYHAGPEIAAATVVGIPAWLLIDPVAGGAVISLIAAYRAVDAWRHRRSAGAMRTRRATDTPTSEDQPTTTDTSDETADGARTEEIA